MVKIKRDERSVHYGREIPSREFILSSVLILSVVFLLFLAMLKPSIVGNVVTEMSLGLKNVPPVMNVTNITIENGDIVNITSCGYDINGDVVTCTYSPPLDSDGFWQTTKDDGGVFVVQVNASDHSDTSTKNISIHVIKKECILTAERLPDYETIRLRWNFSNYYFDNYTLFIHNISLRDSGFELLDAENISFFHEKEWNDTGASESKERYYKIKGFNATDSLLCNVTVGKYEWRLTGDFGRWNYIALPFYQESYHIEDILEPAVSDLEFGYVYNHSAGFFQGWNFNIHKGTQSSFLPNDVLLIKPFSQVNITVAGEIIPSIERNLTLNNGRWNYFGWIAEQTPRQSGEGSIDDKYDFMYWYNESAGFFIGWNEIIDKGDLIMFEPGEGYLVKSLEENLTFSYDMFET